MVGRNDTIYQLEYESQADNHEQAQGMIKFFARVLTSTQTKVTADAILHKLLFEESQMAILIADFQGNILNANAQAQTYFALPSGYFMDLNLREICQKFRIRTTLDDILSQVAEGKTFALETKGKPDGNQLIFVRLKFMSSEYLGKKVVVMTGIDRTSEHLAEEKVLERFHELRIVKDTIRHISGETRLEPILMRVLVKLQELGYWKSAGYYLRNQPSETEYKLRFSLNFPNQVHQILYRIHPKDYAQVFDEKHVLKIRPQFLCPEQTHALLFIPILIDENVEAALVFEPSRQDSNTKFLLSLFGVELSRFVTQVQLASRLANSENKLSIIADNASALLRMTDKQGKFVYFNLPWTKFTGANEESHAQDQWMQFVHPQDISKIRTQFEAHLQNHEIFELSYRVRRKDGEYRHLLETCTPYFNKKDIFQGMICSAVDITDRMAKQAVRTRQELADYSEKRLQEALVRSDIFAFTVNAEGKITFVNNYFTGITGWETHEVLGRPLAKIFSEPNLMQSSFRISEVIQLHEGNILSKEGSKLFITFDPVVLHDAKGGISSVTIVGGDTTEKNKVTLALRKSNRLLYRIFDNVPDLIQIISPAGKFIFVNKVWKDTLGYSDTEISRLNFKDLIHIESYRKTRNDLLHLANVGSLTNFQTAFKAKNGRKIELSGTISCEYEQGKLTSYRAVLNDVTDMLRAEKTQQFYYSTSRLTLKHTGLKDIYHDYYRQLKKTINAESFIIILKNKERNSFSFPYYINPSGDFSEIRGREFAKYTASRFMRPMILHERHILEIVRNQNLHTVQDIPMVWLGAPLIPSAQSAEKDWNKIESMGMVIVQSFQEDKSHNKKELNILSFIARQLVGAIERHQDQDHLKLQSARLQAVYESGNHLMWSVNRSRLITRCNQNYVRTISTIFGIEPKPDTPLSLLRSQFKGYNIALWKQKYRLAFEGKPQQFEVSYQVGGGKIWHKVFLNPIILPDYIEVEEVSGMAYDITESKESEISLAQSEEKFRHIFESFQDVYFRTDMQGQIQMVSPSVKELLGKDSEEVTGQNITDCYIRKNAFQELIQNLIIKGNVTNYQSQIYDGSAHQKTILSNFKLVRNRETNAPIAVDGVARDITELRKAAEALQEAKNMAEKSLEVKKLFLSNMSHEIRTPMNGIIGMTDLLLNTTLTNEQDMYVSTIKNSSDLLLNILNDILDLSKIEEGKMMLRPKAFSLSGLLDKLQAIFITRAREEGIRLFSRFGDHTPEYIIADATRLMQVISNLVSNALKFTHEGSVKINVKTDEQLSGNEVKIKIEVIDTGIGISQENLKILFDKFTQVENNYTKSYAGTGLGLAISKELSHMMGGEIGVSSQLGKGSNFWFTFRAVICDASQVMIEDETHRIELSGQLTHQPDILLVDDNIVNLRVARSILEKSGCLVEMAQSGKKALESIQNRQIEGKMFDLVFMDIQMPVMNGIMTMQEIRKIMPQNCPPIVAMTAYSMQEERDSFIKAGMDDYLAKPVKAKSIIGKVIEWTQKDTRIKNITSSKSGSKTDTAPIPTSPVTPQNMTEPKAQTPPELPIIDLKIVEQLSKYGGMEGIAMFYEDFERETLELMTDAQAGWTQKDREKMRSALHTVKGSAGTLGIERIAKIAKKLEGELKQTFPETTENDFRRLQKYFEEYRQKYKHILKLETTE